MSDQSWIFLLITILVLYKLVKWAEENTPGSNYRPPPPYQSPPPPAPKKELPTCEFISLD